MRAVLIIIIALAICYVILIGPPPSPQDIQFNKFYQLMQVEIADLVDHFQLMPNPIVKITIMLGAFLVVLNILRIPAK